MVQIDNNNSVAVDIRRAIAESNDLLALPDAVIKILELTDKEEIGIDVLSDVVGRDPAITGRLLKIANSSFYGVSQQVGSINQAVMFLGITTVRCLVLSAAVFDPSKLNKNLGIDSSMLYGNIFSVAVTCRKLATACKYSSPDDAFTTGLLHEIGLLFLLQNYPEEYKRVINLAEHGGDLRGQERKYFGIDHAEIGRLIGERWRLPVHITSAVGNHHSFGFEGSEALDDVIRLAVALNIEYFTAQDNDLEEKIGKIKSISERLHISYEHLEEICSATLHDAMSFARAIDLDMGDIESLMVRTNREMFRTYMQIDKLFRERQELTRSILDEERAQGIQEAKQVAISTLSHYINNAAMIISGQSQVMRMLINKKTDKQVVESLPGSLDTIDDSIRKIVATLDEISELNELDDVAFFEKSKILNIDDRIRERIDQLGLRTANQN